MAQVELAEKNVNIDVLHDNKNWNSEVILKVHISVFFLYNHYVIDLDVFRFGL